MLLVALVREVGDDAKMVWQLLPLVDVVYRSRGEWTQLAGSSANLAKGIENDRRQ
jgi:hypothetical protein